MKAILKLYPRTWRNRYEAEVAALIDEHPLRLRDRLDLLWGAIDAHVCAQPASQELAFAGGRERGIVTSWLPQTWPSLLILTALVTLIGYIVQTGFVLDGKELLKAMAVYVPTTLAIGFWFEPLGKYLPWDYHSTRSRTWVAIIAAIVQIAAIAAFCLWG